MILIENVVRYHHNISEPEHTKRKPLVKKMMM
jgi:hypothetical protein